MQVTTGSWPDAAEPIIRKQFVLGLEGIPEERDIFFDVQKSSKEQETLLSHGDIDTFPTFTGSIDYSEPSQNFKKTISPTEYAQGVQIQKRLIITDQIRVVKKLPNLLGVSAKRRILTDTYALLRNAFNATHTGGDGLGLCSTAHTSNVGGANQSNSGTTSLSAVAVDATRILMQKFNTNKDNIQFETTPDALIVPIDLEGPAAEIVKSKGKVDTNNNNINFHFGTYKVLVSRLLTDTTQWFMVNMKKMKENQLWFNLVDMELDKDTDFNTKAARWSAYTFYGFGFERWEHIFGQNPA